MRFLYWLMVAMEPVIKSNKMVSLLVGLNADDFIHCRHSLRVKKDAHVVEFVSFHDGLLNNGQLFIKYLKMKARKYITDEKTVELSGELSKPINLTV